MTLTANVIRGLTGGIAATNISSGILPIARGGTGTDTSTGTGNVVFSNAPVLSNVSFIGTFNLANGSASTPGVSFAGSTSSGLFLSGSNVAVTVSGVETAQVSTQGISVLGHTLGRGGNVATYTNLAFGAGSLMNSTTGVQNTAVGYNAMSTNTTGYENTAYGMSSLVNNTTGFYNTACGKNSLYNNTTGSSNTAFGKDALGTNTTGFENTAYGMSSLVNNTTGFYNTACGKNSLYNNTTGSYNTACGKDVLGLNTTGSYNTGYGMNSLVNNTTGTNNTAVGMNAMNTTNYTNCSAFGYNTAVTADNQVQLGDASTTTYVYGTVQNRSDARDKADVRDTVLGLDFINQLRPVDYKWNLREDYITIKWKLESLMCNPVETTFDVFVAEIKIGTYDPESSKIILEDTLQLFENTEVEFVSNDVPVRPKWKPVEIVSDNDGSKKRTRYHHGFIAQDLQNLDFGGYQDHSVKGGKDVMSLGYDELIAPLVKAVQELAAENTELKRRLEILEP